AEVRAAALGAMGSSICDGKALTLAREASSDVSPAVREAAFAILARTVPAHELDGILDSAWADPAFRVRQAVVTAVTNRGEAVIPALHRQLLGQCDAA